MRRRVFEFQNAVLRRVAASGIALLIGVGSALAQSGDYYGRSVNLASRITGVAKPGSVLVDQEAKRAAPDAFDYSYAGERRLKGFESRTKLYRVRRERGG